MQIAAALGTFGLLISDIASDQIQKSDHHQPLTEDAMSIAKKIALVAALMTAFSAPSFSEEPGASPDGSLCITLGSHTLCLRF
jgi:hypothetical protein